MRLDKSSMIKDNGEAYMARYQRGYLISFYGEKRKLYYKAYICIYIYIAYGCDIKLLLMLWP